MVKQESWVQFDALEFVDRSMWPRVPMRRFLEINPLGEVRYLDTSGSTPEYKPLKPAIYNGQSYFMVPVGWHRGVMVIARFFSKDLVKRFFT